jgi:membrane-associated phospholipid phosphatase
LDAFLIALPFLFAAVPAGEETAPSTASKEKRSEPEVEAVTPHGQDVPTVAPGLTDELAPILAPEKKPEIGNTVVTEPHLSVYDVDLPLEASLTAASFGLFIVMDMLIKPTLEGDISCRRPIGNGRCNPDDLIAFDRYAVGRSSKEWEALSDVALFTSIAIPVLYLGLESIVLPTTTPWGDFAGDMLIVAEAMALTGAFQNLIKFAVRRPRPVRYTDLQEPLTPFDAELSFPSGHAAMVASATTALTTTLFLRHPDSPMRWVVLGAGATLTALTAFARVESGNHFPTDVIVGSFIGAFSGFVVPYLHRKKIPLTPTAGLNPVNGSTTFGVTGRF